MLFVPLLAALLTVASTKSDVVKTDTLIRNPSPVVLPVTLNRTVMLQLVNKVRQSGCQCGDTYYYPVPALSWSGQLEEAAYNHSADMYKNNYFSHTGPDGKRGGDRIEATGYYWKAFGENIATGYKNEREVVEGWISSPGHCKNIMNKLYKEMGVARVGNYWTQEFAAR